MRGQVTSRTLKRTGKRVWDLVVELPRDAENKWRRLVRRGFRTRREAEAKLAAVLDSLGKGTFVEPDRVTTGQYLGTWTDSLGNLKASTRMSYATHVRLYLDPELGHIPLQRLAPEHVRALVTKLGERGLKPATVRRVHATLHRALADAVEDRKLTVNPASLGNKKLPRVERHEIQAWELDELATFLGHVKAHRLHALFYLAADTGMRRGELLGLRWQDVDLDSGMLSVRQSLIAIHHETRFETPKNGKGRSLELDPSTVKVLRAHKARQGDVLADVDNPSERLAWGPAWTDSGLVFTREDGVPLHPDTVSKMFAQLVEAAGVRRIRFHDLRHTCATLALKDRTVAAKAVQERLGHSSIAVTLDIYSHLTGELGRQAAGVLSRAMER